MYQQCIPDTLVLPDEVRRSSRIGNARLFSRLLREELFDLPISARLQLNEKL